MLIFPPLTETILGPTIGRRCKLCGGDAPVFGAVDFNRHCSETGEPKLTASGIPISYNRCAACGFLFSGALDEWTHEQFQTYIYNADYHLVDPDYETERPAANLTWMIALFKNARDRRFVDYGGGNGALAKLMRGDGFTHASTYDPFNPDYAQIPKGTFDVVTCFETMEHVPDPLGTVGALCTLAGDHGLVFFSTMPQPDDIDTQGLNWWYVAPRNGHISLYSGMNLQTSFNRFGFQVVFFDHCHFLAFREVPDFARHLFDRFGNTAGYAL